VKYRVTTAPTVEPVSIAEAQAQTRSVTTDTTENTLLTALIVAAREYCEKYTRRALAPQTIEAYPESFYQRMELPMPPLTAVTSIKYTDTTATENTFTGYVVDTYSEPGRIAIPENVSFPSFTQYVINPIKIVYTCGYTAATIPKAIKQAILLLVGHWYINREAAGVEVSKPIEFSVKNLLSLYKVGYF